MKCKYCGAEMKHTDPNWYDCENCKTYWKFVGLDVDAGKILLQPYKALPVSQETIDDIIKNAKRL